MDAIRHNLCVSDWSRTIIIIWQRRSDRHKLSNVRRKFLGAKLAVTFHRIFICCLLVVVILCLCCGVVTSYWKILDCRERFSEQGERLGGRAACALHRISGTDDLAEKWSCVWATLVENGLWWGWWWFPSTVTFIAVPYTLSAGFVVSGLSLNV